MELGDYKTGIISVLDQFDFETIEPLVVMIEKCWLSRKRILIAGNGGSGSIASHIVADIAKGLFLETGSSPDVRCLTDNTAIMTAYSNDCGYADVLALQIEALDLQSGELVILVSGSGNSPNIIEAAKAVKASRYSDVTVVGLCAFGGGKLAEIAHYSIVVPTSDMQLAEDVFGIILHATYRALLDNTIPCKK